MEILVNGEKRELVAEGTNGIEWTNDLLGNHDALHHDEETEEYTMTEDEFDWWEEVINNLNKVQELEDKLEKDDRAEYDAYGFNDDIDTEAKQRLAWLTERGYK